MDTITGPKGEIKDISTPTTDQLEQITGMNGAAVEAKVVTNPIDLEGRKGARLEELRSDVRAAADTAQASATEMSARQDTGFAPEAIPQASDILGQQDDTVALSEQRYQQGRSEDLQRAADEQEAKHTAKEPLWNKFKNLFKRGESKTGGEN